jgi:hypothetical protein
MAFSDRELLARTLQAEAGNQGPAGMLAAGSVIMNRTKTQGYGDGLQGVIMKPGQFSVWNGVTGYAGGEQGQDMAAMAPSGSAYAAADTLIGGQYNDPTGGATHYYNPSISQPSWGIDNGGDWTRIGDHVFGNADAASGTQARNNVGQEIANDTMRALERQPAERSAPTRGILSNEGDQMDRQQPQGLLGSLGIQRRDPNAQGETAQPFYNRQSFGDTLARVAPALGRMGVMGLEGPAQAALDTRNQRQGEERARREKDAQTNQSLEFLRTSGRDDLVAAHAAGLPIGDAIAIAIAPAEGSFTQVTGADLGMTGESANQTFNVGPDGKVTGIGGAAPVTNINNNMGPDESEFNKETGKILAQEANTIVEQGSLAQRSLGQINTLEQALLSAPAGAEGSLVNFAANIGIKMEGSSNIELANAIISQLVPAQRPPGSGVMSDADLALFKASLPRLINTREGNQLIINTIRNVAQYDIQRGEIARGLQLGQITPDQAAVQYQELGNPLSGFQSQNSGGGGGGADLSGMSDAQLQAIVEGGQ